MIYDTYFFYSYYIKYIKFVTHDTYIRGRDSRLRISRTLSKKITFLVPLGFSLHHSPIFLRPSCVTQSYYRNARKHATASPGKRYSSSATSGTREINMIARRNAVYFRSLNSRTATKLHLPRSSAASAVGDV